MNKNPLSLATIIAAATLSSTAVSHGAQITTVTSLDSTAAAEFGRWIYQVAPARPDLLLPLVFVVTVLTVAAMVVHHLRQNQELQVLEDRFAPVSRLVQRNAARLVAPGVLLPRRLA